MATLRYLPWSIWAALVILQDFGQTALGVFLALAGLLVLAWPELAAGKRPWALLAYPLFLVVSMSPALGGRVDLHLERAALFLLLMFVLLAEARRPVPERQLALALGAMAGAALTLLPLSWPVSLDQAELVRLGVASMSLRGILWGCLSAVFLLQACANRTLPRPLLLLLSGLCLAGVFLDGSTGAVLGLALGGVVATLHYRRRIPARLFWGLAGLAGAAGGVALVLRLKELDPFSLQRLDMWGLALRFWRDHPVLGGGVHALERFHHAYDFPLEQAVGRFSRVTRDPHSLLFTGLTEGGVLGLSAVALSAWTCGRLCQAQNPAGPWKLALAGLAVFLGCGLVSPLPGPVPVVLLFLLVSAAFSRTGEAKTPAKSRPGASPLIAGVLLAGGCWLALTGVLENALIRPGLEREALQERHLLLWKLAPVRVDQARRAARTLLPLSAGELYWWDQGLDWVDRAERHGPGEAPNAILRVNYDQALGKPPPSAGIHLQTAVRRAPNSAFLQRDLAFYLLRQGNVKAAAAAFEQTLTLEPRYLQARLEQIRLLRETGQEELAAAQVRLAKPLFLELAGTPQGTPYEERLVAFDVELAEALLGDWRTPPNP